VNVTVGAGSANDGELGEGDEILDVSGVRSGSGADTLSLLQTVDAELDGGAGADTLATAGGDDVLVGGAGVDTLSSGLGVDRIAASDGDRDTIDCGGDSPDEALVASSGVEGSIKGCENVVRARPPASSTGPRSFS
jgi:Ca2+-binding RTX toxin-like protein